MKLIRVILFVPALCLTTLLSISTFADMPPEPGSVRVESSVILQTDADLADYRFFVDCRGLRKEFFLRKGEETTVSSPGGGARGSSGVFLAVPVKSFASSGDNSNRSEAIEKAFANGDPAGTIWLFEHQFYYTVPKGTADSVSDKTYRIDRKNGVITAVPVTTAPVNSPKKNVQTNMDVQPSGFGTATLIAGILMALGIAVLGIWMIGKRKKAS